MATANAERRAKTGRLHAAADCYSSSCAAIVTNAASESACILRITRPRCAFSVTALTPLLVGQPADAQLHDIPLPMTQRVVALEEHSRPMDEQRYPQAGYLRPASAAGTL